MFRCGMATPRTRADVICMLRLTRYLSCGAVDHDFFVRCPFQWSKSAMCAPSEVSSACDATSDWAGCSTFNSFHSPTAGWYLYIGFHLSMSLECTLSHSRGQARLLQREGRRRRIEASFGAGAQGYKRHGEEVVPLFQHPFIFHGVSPIYPEGRPHALDVRLRKSLC